MDEFGRWFADQYGTEIEGAERVHGTCDVCGNKTQVFLTGRPLAMGDGECLSCLRNSHDWYEKDVQRFIAAIRGAWGGGLPTEEAVTRCCADAFRRFGEAFEKELADFARAA
jgi:hypothetical protein